MRWYVNCFEKLRCFDRVDLVFDGDENGTIAGLGFREHCGSWQVIPYSRVVLGSGNEKGERKSRHAVDSHRRNEKGLFQTGSSRQSAPKDAANRHAALKNEKIDGEDASEHCGRHRNDSGNSREQSPKSAGKENNGRRPEQESLNAR